jgi:peptide/nickel transport system substrate-binding protein
MKKKLRTGSKLALIASIAFVVLFTSGITYAKEMLRLATPYIVSTLDPIKSVDAGDIMILGQLHARLLRRSPDGLKLLPGLAEEWKSSDAGKTYTFNLRDAKFSDGSTITAEDVVFSFLRLRDQEDSVYKAAFQVIDTITAKDKKTVVFKLKAPTAPFLASVEIFNAAIVPKAVVKKLGDDAFGRNPVSAGPFRLVEWKIGDRLILEKNPNYWRKGRPFLDGVEWKIVTDPNTRVSMVQTGEAHVILDVPWNKIAELRSDSNIDLPLEPSTQIWVGLLNHDKEPFNDVRVRRAIAHAINTPAMVNALTMGHAEIANSPLPKNIDYHNPKQSTLSYDPTKAKQLLTQAGKSNLEIELMSTTGDIFSEQAAIVLQAQLAAIGVKIKIVKTDTGQWWDRLISGDYQMSVTWWYNENTDPDLAVRWAFCGSCDTLSYFTRFNNDKVNQLIEEGVKELDPKKRKAIYYKIQKLTKDEVSQLPLFYTPYRNAYRGIEGLMMSPAIQFSLDEAKFKN